MFVQASAATTIKIFFSMRRCYPIITLFLLSAAASAQTPKPAVVLYRNADCARCDEFEKVTLHHPIIERRLPGVDVRIEQTAERPYIALFDADGKLKTRWLMVPDTINFGVMLDTALYGAATTRYTAPPDTSVIRILPTGHQVVIRREWVKTRVNSSAVARVAFALDGREITRIGRPPFSTTLDFGAVPERHVIRAVAFDRKGKELGRDERIVNEGGETFWLKLIEPREGAVGGPTHVSMSLRVPPLNRVQRVVISWNDADRAVLTSPPWEKTIHVPEDSVGIVRAVAELEDGRTSEDAVLLNSRGYVDSSNVQLVQLPVTIFGTFSNISVREGKTPRVVQSVAKSDETPLTVGLLLDASDSMEKTLPDLQEAAIRFLDTVLGPRDRAFVVSFDTRAHLLQPPTSDKAALRAAIMHIRPDGLTSLYDAMALGLLQFEGIKGRRAMIVFNDGFDMTSEYEAPAVGELARRVSVPVHAIGPSGQDLVRVAKMTGGTSQPLDDLAQLPAIFARIESALRAQVLVFIRRDPAKRENEWRNVNVTVEGSDPSQVYAPAGYYATW